VIDFPTPRQRAGVPVSAFAMWLAEWMWQRQGDTLRREIANYRAMVMQGMNVSAPRYAVRGGCEGLRVWLRVESQVDLSSSFA
jgi:hypothetical protein